jgi:hypothetical protein
MNLEEWNKVVGGTQAPAPTKNGTARGVSAPQAAKVKSIESSEIVQPAQADDKAAAFIERVVSLPATAPAPLRGLPGWLVWKAERDGERVRKVPYYAEGGRRAGLQGAPEDRAQLVTFEAACTAALRRGFDGVGLALMPEWGVCALDFDRCIGDSGELPAEIRDIASLTYAERSPSGRGVRAFVRGNLGDHKDHGEPYGFEVFSTKGFVTVTGDRLDLVDMLGNEDVIADPPACLLALCETRFRRQDAEASPDAVSAPLGLAVEDLQRALAVLDPSMPHDPWLRVGMALHHETAGERFDLWDEWSSRGNTYPGTEKLRERWDSFGRSTRQVTAAWLMHLANECGAGINLASLVADDFEVISDAPAMPRSSQRELKQADQVDFIDFAQLAVAPPPPRRWVVDQWLPRGAVTALFGRGGHGKSLAAQQLAIAVANGLPWLGWATTGGPALGMFCEDDADELLRRAGDIFASELLEPAQASGGLFLDARAGKVNTLMSFGQDHVGRPEPLLVELRHQCSQLRPALVVLDNIAQMFAGQENARAEATQFCNALTAIAREFDCAVLLLGHLAKAEGSEFSGSTAWDAAVRSRLMLERQSDGTTVLRKLKANYSDLDEIRLQYRAGCFAALPTGANAPPDLVEAVKHAVVEAVHALTARRQPTSHNPTTRNYLPKLMVAEGLNEGHGVDLLRSAMGALIDAGTLIPDAELWRKPDRHMATGLALAEGAR